MNTSMTINATAAWLLALYVAVADEQGADRKALRGTTQNDILKEYLSRGTFIFPPEPSIRLTADTIEFTGREVPKWNPVNVCSYHLQEAGADPVLEIAYTLANAVCILDAVRDRGMLTPERVGALSFFCNAGIRFVEETCKMRAFTRLWDRITTRAVRRRGREVPAVPVRRPGELARPHRGAAGEQRLPDPARDARRDDVEGRSCARRPAAGVERSARTPPRVGPAVVSPRAADPRLRDRPPRVRGHLRGIGSDRREDERDRRSGLGRVQQGARLGWLRRTRSIT